MKDLVVKFTGKISENTFPEYKEQAVAFVKRANFPIVGNEDFSNAVNDVKKCGEIELKITTVIDSVFSGAKEVNTLVDDLRAVYATVRTFRLKREKDIAAETEIKRNKLIADGFKKVSALYCEELKNNPRIKHVISISESPFREAVKGKRTEASGKKAIESTVEMETQKIKDAVILVTDNGKLISESGYSELFPDLTTIISKPTSEIKLIVDGRVATHKLKEKERKEREAERVEKERKAEEERKIAESHLDNTIPPANDSASGNTQLTNVENTKQSQKKAEIIDMVGNDCRAETAKRFVPPKVSENEDFTLSVDILCSVEKAKEFAQVVSDYLIKYDFIIRINLSRKTS